MRYIYMVWIIVGCILILDSQGVDLGLEGSIGAGALAGLIGGWMADMESRR
jgi:hypothetical protein